MPAPDLERLLRAQVHNILVQLVHQDVLPGGPTTVAAQDGPIDVVLSVYVRPCQVTTQAQAQQPNGIPDTPNNPPDSCVDTPPESEMEENIVEAIGGSTLKAREVAERAGYPLNSYFRAKLSALCRGLNPRLRCTRAGYQVIESLPPNPPSRPDC